MVVASSISIMGLVYGALWRSVRQQGHKSRQRRGAAAELGGGLAGPALEGADKTFLVLKARRLGHLLDRALGAQQQLGGAALAHFVFQGLQRGAFFFELAVQCAR